jgi:TRAP-type C4-dicarboxylate transport system permease small subunit
MPSKDHNTPVPDADDAVVQFLEEVSPGASLIEQLCELLCGIALVAMIGLIAAEAFARNLFNTSMQITDEIGGYLFVAVSFLSLCVAEAHGAFHRVELVQTRLGMRARLLTQIVFDAMALAATAILTWQLGRLVMNSWRSEDVAPTPLLTLLWIPQATMPIGTAILCFSLMRTILAKTQRLREPNP